MCLDKMGSFCIGGNDVSGLETRRLLRSLLRMIVYDACTESGFTAATLKRVVIVEVCLYS